ncbi:MAG: hypothetical protein AAGL92_00190 [Pseudomonadota bacterium]
MSQPVLRRRAIPRLQVSAPGSAGKCTLPSFLTEASAISMTPTPIIGPHDALEDAILRGDLWHPGSDPIEIDAFDAERDVVSIILEDCDDNLRLDVEDMPDGTRILANGQPMARVSAKRGKCSLSNIRVLHSRS